MATVLISRAVKRAVEYRIQQMREAEMASFTPAMPTTDMTALIEHVLWGEHLPLLQQIPHRWLHDVGTLRLQVNGLSSNHDMRLKLTAAKAKMPPTAEYVPYNKELVMSKAQLFDANLDAFVGVQELRDAVALTEEGATVSDKWNGVHAAITNLLSFSRSINEAVASVPALRLYLDNETKARLDLVVEKAASNTKASRAARAAALVANIDVAGIATSGVAGTLILGNTK